MSNVEVKKLIKMHNFQKTLFKILVIFNKIRLELLKLTSKQFSWKKMIWFNFENFHLEKYYNFDLCKPFYYEY
jgi:hypothetical protein